jgi:hypothetical protein
MKKQLEIIKSIRKPMPRPTRAIPTKKREEAEKPWKFGREDK